MTVNEAIAAAVRSIGDEVSREELTEWLAQIENTVVCEIAATHEGDTSDKTLITSDGDGNRVLFVPDPYSRLYVNYLIMKCDLSLRDIPQYMNSAAVFSESYKEFADRYNRAYMPLGERAVKL
ncbi:MAG: hypothetical protein E7647_03600 [Ruminococcaceae bacterium]|nr:hypothetical protein [Oscillospiraceae bacterium]